MKQLDLLSRPAAAHATGRDTEHAAARQADSYVATDRQAVFDALTRSGAQSATQIATRLGWSDVYRARRRISDLVNAGLVKDTGRRANTQYGRAEAIWQVNEGGQRRE